MADDEQTLLPAEKERTRHTSGKPPLERVEEVDHGKKGMPCPDFGVRSYLHQFYDSEKSFKDPSIYEEEEDDEDDLAYLLRPRRRKRCRSVWWKIFVWIGANLLIFGILGILISFLIPPHKEVIGVEDSVEKVDRGAVYFNYSLDVCKLISLIVFCVGGVTLTIALIFPSFFNHYCDDRSRDDDWRAPPAPEGSVKRIPYSSKISNVQPKEKHASGVVKFMDDDGR